MVFRENAQQSRSRQDRWIAFIVELRDGILPFVLWNASVMA